MDLVEACRAFVSVADRSSFTHGASAARTSQSGASRRIAALEAELGGTLFDRSARRAALTGFGRQMLPAARRVVEAAEQLAHEAVTLRSRPVRLALPEGYDVRDLAGLELAGHDHGIPLALVPAGPRARAQLVASEQAEAALLPRGADEATWEVVLGIASALPAEGMTHLDQLRPHRSERREQRRTVWLLPEDAVPHVRDVVVRHGEAAGLLPSQVQVAASPGAALAAVLGSRDVLLSSRAEAEAMQLHWAPLRHPDLRRGYALLTVADGDPEALVALLDEALPTYLGVSRP